MPLPLPVPPAVYAPAQDMNVTVPALSLEEGRNHVIADIAQKWSGYGYSVSRESYDNGQYHALIHLVETGNKPSETVKSDDSPDSHADETKDVDTRDAPTHYHTPRYILVISGDGKQWGDYIGPGTSFKDKVSIVPTVGDSMDHQNISDPDYVNILSGNIPDTISGVMDKYRTDTIAVLGEIQDGKKRTAMIIQSYAVHECSIGVTGNTTVLSDLLHCL